MKQKLKRRNPIAREMLTNKRYTPKIIPNKKHYNRKKGVKYEQSNYLYC